MCVYGGVNAGVMCAMYVCVYEYGCGRWGWHVGRYVQCMYMSACVCMYMGVEVGVGMWGEYQGLRGLYV